MVLALALVALVWAGLLWRPSGKQEVARDEAPTWSEESPQPPTDRSAPADVARSERPRRLSDYPASKDPPAYGLPLIITISDVPEVPAEIRGPTSRL